MAICKNCPAAPKDSEAQVCKAGVRRLLVFHDGQEQPGCYTSEGRIKVLFEQRSNEIRRNVQADIMYCFGARSTENRIRNAILRMSKEDLLDIAKDYTDRYLAHLEQDRNVEFPFSFEAVSAFTNELMSRDRRFDPVFLADMECCNCGDGFTVEYHADGTYDYVTPGCCECEADFRPADGVPSISAWLATLF